MPPTFIRLHDQLFDAGTASTTFDERLQRSVFEFTPPQTSLFDQVVDYLNHQPDVPHRHFRGGEVGVGIAALSIRWGSYLATLMDADTLPHPNIVLRQRKAQDQRVSWIDDAEMQRLHVEIAENLARLGRLYHEDCDAYMRLVGKAYQYLPMPIRSARPNRQLNDALIQAKLVRLTAGYDLDRDEVYRAEASSQDRLVGSLLSNAAWRSSSIEWFHSGQNNPVLLTAHERRFTLNEERKLLRELSGNMLVVDRAFGQLGHLYDGDFPSPHSWGRARRPDAAAAPRTTVRSEAYLVDWPLSEMVSLASL